MAVEHLVVVQCSVTEILCCVSWVESLSAFSSTVADRTLFMFVYMYL